MFFGVANSFFDVQGRTNGAGADAQEHQLYRDVRKARAQDAQERLVSRWEAVDLSPPAMPATVRGPCAAAIFPTHFPLS